MYFAIRESMNTKIVGKYFQSENIANNMGDNPKFLNNIYFEKIDFEPIVSIPILHKKAKITDLISCVNAGGNLHLIMSEKLKNIILKFRNQGLQFFNTSIIKDNIEYSNFFSVNMYETNMEFIDFERSKVSVREKKKEGGTELKPIKVGTLEEFLLVLDYHKQKMEVLTINNIFLNKEINEDFFMLKYVFGGMFYVSKKLKKEIEDAGCTGIEFQPTEFSIYEWLQGGEREKIYGKV